jgi:hypothetical protein
MSAIFAGFVRRAAAARGGWRAYSGILAAEVCAGLLLRFAGRASGSVFELRQSRNSELNTGSRAALGA